MKSISNLFIRRKLFFTSQIQNSIRYLSSPPHNTNVDSPNSQSSFKYNLKNGPSLQEFIAESNTSNEIPLDSENIPYLDNSYEVLRERTVYLDVYGCQMNVNDTEIVWSILKKNNFVRTDTVTSADVVLIVTCAIREGAENKVWNRIRYLRNLKKQRAQHPLKIGVLGCMAERLKHQLIEKEKAVDLVAGPDSYKDLPRLLALTENNQTAVNVLLSLDETYADILPVRLNENSKSAFVSIMRGCDNMCTYCIVPFTRGKERSRDVESILNEIKHLSDQGVKEVTLLGQNVNSYRDMSQVTKLDEPTKLVKGFKTVYKIKKGGLRFADLLDKVSLVDPEMRIRFTSPHPKDFPDEVLQIIKERPNICKSLHLPVQSGSSTVLERMRRGYTRESYLELVEHVRNFIPGVSLSSDFICGFCSETEEEFAETISLMKIVKHNMGYFFGYSMREKTTAHRRYKDDVPEEVKRQRLIQMIETHRNESRNINLSKIGDTQLVLVNGPSRKSPDFLETRNDWNSKVYISNIEVPDLKFSHNVRKINPGDYVAVKIVDANSQNLKGTPLFHTTLCEYEFYCNKELKIKSAV